MPDLARAADPVTAAVVAHRLDAIAAHVGETMLRTSRSPVFQIGDFATGIFTADGRWVATCDMIPVLAGSLPSAYAAVVARFGADVAPGDVFVLNDPFHGNNHPPDVTVLRPVHHGGALVFWVLSKGHHIDVGAGAGGVMGVNPEATTVWDEALRIPPVRLVAGGEPVRDVWDLILLNVRARELVEGDLRCQVGATAVGAEGLTAMLDELGVEAVGAAIDVRLATSRRRTAAEIGALRDGVYRAERHLESGGARVDGPVRIVLEARVDGERLTLDFSGSDPQVDGFVNSTAANTRAACMVALMAMAQGPLTPDDGVLDQLQVITRPGTVTEAVAPAATLLCTLTTAETIIETVWLALADATEHGAPAAWAHTATFAQIGTEADGRRFGSGSSMLRGGAGAVHGSDGWDGLGSAVSMGGAATQDPERFELASPMTVLEVAMTADSGGAGTWRGGLGGRVAYRVDQPAIALFRAGGTTAGTAPFGLRGGGAGQPNRGTIVRADGRRDVIATDTIGPLAPGDTVVVELTGGGGFGPPTARDPAAVAQDVRAGLVSPAAAHAVYAVALAADGTVDATATATLRAAPR